MTAMADKTPQIEQPELFGEMLATLKAVKLALPILRDTLSRIGLPLGVSAADDLLDQVNDTIAKAERR